MMTKYVYTCCVHGQCYAMWSPKVTHLIAAQTDRKVAAEAKFDRDVIDVAWLLECATAKQLVALQPKHYMHLSAASKTQANAGLKECLTLDPYGDP